MTVHNQQFNVSYISAPKCASTSLKTFFFELENGFEWRNYRRNGFVVHIHHCYPARDFDVAIEGRREGAFTFTLLRDPVERLVSCYKNRIRTGPAADMLAARPGRARNLGLEVKPSFAAFVDNIEGYRDFSADVAAHSDPLVKYLGRDASVYDRIYDISEMDVVFADLQRICGVVPQIQHLQRRGKEVQVTEVDADTESKIKAFYAEDYAVFGEEFEKQRSKHTLAHRAEA